MEQPYPILEFDPAPEAIYSPQHHIVRSADVPERCVLCFFHDVLAALRDRGAATPVAMLGSELGPNPVYRIEVAGEPVALVHPGVGAPMAAFFLEELIALGCTTFIACGGAGVLDREIAVGHLVVPVAAIRDEGTSYHYLPPGREVAPDPAALAAIERVLSRQHVAYHRARTWTTDGLYRETPARVQRRRAEGCATVEMEAAALFAVARFRGVPLAQILYGGDDVSGLDDWDHRGWDRQGDLREALCWLAAEAALEVGRSGSGVARGGDPG
jgi:nucleoside phosphorylase